MSLSMDELTHIWQETLNKIRERLSDQRILKHGFQILNRLK